jgi:hypothetical protein
MGKSIHNRNRHEGRLARRYMTQGPYRYYNYTWIERYWVEVVVLGEKPRRGIRGSRGTDVQKGLYNPKLVSPDLEYTDFTYWEVQELGRRDSFVEAKKHTKTGTLTLGNHRLKPYRDRYNKDWRRRNRQFSYRMLIGDESRAERINLEKDKGFWRDVF